MPARAALTLFHIRGIRVGVDYSWFVILFFVIIWLQGFYEAVPGVESGSTPYLLAVISALAFFASILLHELGHAVVAIRNGIGISEITLWLFGGVARMARDSDSAGTEFKIAAAGPAVTLAIAFACTAAGVTIAGSEEGFMDAMVLEDGAAVEPALAVLAWLASVNVVILLFNLLPAFPMDGGRIARAIAWKLTGDRTRATRFAATLGQGFAYVFVALGVLLLLSGVVISGIMLAVIGLLLGSAARGSAARNEMSRKIEGLNVEDVMDPEPVAIPQEASAERALEEFFLRYGWPWFPVTDGDGRFLGVLPREAAEAVPESERASRPVADLVAPDGRSNMQVRADAPLESLLGNEALRRLGGLAAVDPDGRLRGIITVQQVGRALRDAVAPAP